MADSVKKEFITLSKFLGKEETSEHKKTLSHIKWIKNAQSISKLKRGLR